MKIYLVFCNKVRGCHFLEPSVGYYRAHVCKQTLKFEYGTASFPREIFLLGGGARARGRPGVCQSALCPPSARHHVHASHTLSNTPTHKMLAKMPNYFMTQ